MAVIRLKSRSRIELDGATQVTPGIGLQEIFEIPRTLITLICHTNLFERVLTASTQIKGPKLGEKRHTVARCLIGRFVSCRV